MSEQRRPEFIPLFDLPEDSGEPGKGEAGAAKSLRSVAQGNCPRCMAPKTGLVASGAHIVWRVHYLTTWAGSRIPCVTSGVSACDAPEVTPLKPSNPVRCPHDR